MAFERLALGCVGTTITLSSGISSHFRYIIHRFSAKDSSEEWEKSEQAICMLKEANNYSTLHYETATGMEIWFTMPDLRATVSAIPK